MKLVQNILGILCAVTTSLTCYGVEITGTSVQGKSLVVSFDGDKVTQDSSAATLCSNQTITVEKVRLWMPDHGHGSTPTSLARLSDECTKIQSINFSMNGRWQLNILLSEQDSAVIEVNVVD
jgi:hypothetical protein